MKNLKRDFRDSLRAEYKRSDFGEMVRGKYADKQIEFAELVSLLVGCIGDEEGLTFTHHSLGNHLAAQQPGDWTYEIDGSNQITLRYWESHSVSLAEPIATPSSIRSSQQRSDLKDLIQLHVRALKTRARTI